MRGRKEGREKMRSKSVFKSAAVVILAAFLLTLAGCNFDSFYIRVALIEGVPETGETRTPLTLTGTVRPFFANSRDIAWSVKDAGTTGASISGNIINTRSDGTVTIRAVVANGIAQGKDFTQDFKIEFTVQKVITDIAVITQPAKLTYTEGEALDISGLVVTLTYDDDSTETTGFADFAETGITTNPAQGTALSLAHNGHTVMITGGNGAAYTDPLTVKKETEFISSVALTITDPVKNEKPSTDAGGGVGGHFTIGEISWSPPDNPFNGKTVYKAAVILTADEGFKFPDSVIATVNGNDAAASANTGTTVTISYEFAETSDKVITGITITSQPEKLAYTEGETLNLSGLKVTLDFDIGPPEEAAYSTFNYYNIEADPPHGTALSTAHNGQQITITGGLGIAHTNPLTVTGTPTISVTGVTLDHSALTMIIGGTETLTASVLPSNANNKNVTWSSGNTSIADVTDGEVTAIAAGTAVITVTTEDGDKTAKCTVTVNKKPGAAVAAPVITWNAAEKRIDAAEVTAPDNGQKVEYNISKANDGSGLEAWQDGRSFTVSSAATYYVYARSKENTDYYAGAPNISHGLYVVSQGINIEFTLGESPTVNTGVVISRSGSNGPDTATLTVSNSANYTGITWYYNNTLLGNGATVTLDSSNPAYNMIGRKFIRVEAWKGGVPYITNVEFEVKP